MQKAYYYIANWKMYFSYLQAIAWYNDNKNQLQQLADASAALIICPSYDSLAYIAQLTKSSPVLLGAQNCSEHLQGAFTGQISAQSLKEIGINYCIIGHSEVRTACQDTNKQLKQKLQHLIEQNIIPLFCIGESLEEYHTSTTHRSLEKQLEPIFELLNNRSISTPFFIAYEPLWAIGTGVVAHNEHIISVLAAVKKIMKTCKEFHQFRFLYGGTVTSGTISELKKIENLDGFLIGKASTDFQELKKIVL